MSLNYNKYHFQLLSIGESQHVIGKLTNIRSAASMYGTRYGVWLRVEKAPQGANVTRLPSPAQKKVRTREVVEKTLARHEDALRFISLICIEIRDLLKKG